MADLQGGAGGIVDFLPFEADYRKSRPGEKDFG